MKTAGGKGAEGGPGFPKPGFRRHPEFVCTSPGGVARPGSATP